MFYTVFI